MIRTILVHPRLAEHLAQLVCDASPWGMGAVLLVDGVRTAWMASEWTDYDYEVLDTVAGPEGQDLFEALALLVAMRTWVPMWSEIPTTIVVQSDSLAALGSAAKLGSSIPHMNLIVRELALEFAEGTFEVELYGHVPGHLNVEADALSRLTDPNQAKVVPESLATVPRTPVAQRTAAWWRTRSAPTASSA